MYKPIILCISFFLMLSCSESENKVQPEKTAIEPSGVMEVKDGWARPAKAGMTSAAYFHLMNGTAETDTLIAASSDVSDNTQVHLSYMKDEMMVMEEQDAVPVPAGETVPFKQGGYHIMFIQPDNDINEGDSVALTLYFSSGDSLMTKVEVRPANGSQMHHH